MTILAAGLKYILDYWYDEWHEIEVLDSTEAYSLKKEIGSRIISESPAYLETSVLFYPEEANFTIAKVKLYAKDGTLIAENGVNIAKTASHSLTITRRDYLQEV